MSWAHRTRRNALSRGLTLNIDDVGTPQDPAFEWQVLGRNASIRASGTSSSRREANSLAIQWVDGLAIAWLDDTPD